MVIKVVKGSEGKFNVIFKYNTDLIEKIKLIDGHKWDTVQKHCTIPDD